MAVSVEPEGRGLLCLRIDGATSTANAGLGQYKNPEGVDLMILRTTLFVKDDGGSTANLGVGVAASGAKGTDIVNDLAMTTTTGKVYNGHVRQNTAKTESTTPALWAADKYITVTGSATTAGLVAYLLVDYVRLA